MVVKERRTKILLALLLLSDLNLGPVALDETVQKIFDLSFNQKTRGTLSALIKETQIRKVEGKEPNTYELTPSGFLDLCLQFPSFRFLKEKWDGKWRIISYEIPEKKRELRDRLRREMQGWGLGPWHRSFWLTPHPVMGNLRELVSQKEEEKYIQAFESDHVFGDREILIEKVWQKSLLDKKYREMFKGWHDVLSQEIDKLQKLTKIINDYILTLRQDPGLPKELVGETWIGFEAYSLFKEIRSILIS